MASPKPYCYHSPQTRLLADHSCCVFLNCSPISQLTVDLMQRQPSAYSISLRPDASHNSDELSPESSIHLPGGLSPYSIAHLNFEAAPADASSVVELKKVPEPLKCDVISALLSASLEHVLKDDQEEELSVEDTEELTALKESFATNRSMKFFEVVNDFFFGCIFNMFFVLLICFFQTGVQINESGFISLSTHDIVTWLSDSLRETHPKEAESLVQICGLYVK